MRKLILAVTATVAASLAATLTIAAGATATTHTERFSFADTSTSSGPPAWSVIATGQFIAGGKARIRSGICVSQITPRRTMRGANSGLGRCGPPG